MRIGRARTLILVGLLGPAAAWTQESSFIHGLKIRGSRRPVELETHAGQTLDRARLGRDVRRLWASGWFDDIRIESSETPEGIQLVFTLVEKPRLYLRRVEFEPAHERHPLGLAPGAPLDAVLAHRVAAALRQQLVAEGHAEAKVEAKLTPTSFQEADLYLRVEPGPAYRVEEVRFTGRLDLPPRELQRALGATRVRRLFPGVAGWRGWLLHPPYSRQAIDADLELLRSHYATRGYFEARVALAGVEFSKEKATITIAVDAGARYRVRRVDVDGAATDGEVAGSWDGAFPARELCRCLGEARRQSERAGALDFSARLELEPTEEPPWAGLEEEKQGWVRIRAKVEPEPPYTVGRIEFRGHHAFSDLTLRRAWPLREGDLFDRGQLRRSLAELNRMGFFDPVSEQNVVLEPDPDGQRVHLTVWLKEQPRGKWLASGPLGPLSLAGPLQFAIGSRLPAWGEGGLELSTFYGSVSLLGFSQPWVSALSVVPRRRWRPLVAVERPYLPGQAWQSGFLLAPQLGWKGTLASFALTHARQAGLTALRGNPTAAPALAVPLSWRTPKEEPDSGAVRPVGYLLCEAPRSRFGWLRVAAAVAVDLLLTPRLL